MRKVKQNRKANRIRVVKQISQTGIDKIGSPGRIRTYNLAVNSRPLYH